MTRNKVARRLRRPLRTYNGAVLVNIKDPAQTVRHIAEMNGNDVRRRWLRRESEKYPKITRRDVSANTDGMRSIVRKSISVVIIYARVRNAYFSGTSAGLPR